MSADDVVLLSALVEHAKQRSEPDAASERTVPAGFRPSAAAAMNTRVEFEDLESGQRDAVWLVHPSAVDAGARRISVLSPVGRALLGKRAGQEVEVRLPNGDSRELMVIAVHDGESLRQPLGEPR